VGTCEEEDIWSKISKELTNIFGEKITLKENSLGQISIASSELSQTLKTKIRWIVKNWYERKKPSKEKIEYIINKVELVKNKYSYVPRIKAVLSGIFGLL